MQEQEEEEEGNSECLLYIQLTVNRLLFTQGEIARRQANLQLTSRPA